jgi:hypothetical protein
MQKARDGMVAGLRLTRIYLICCKSLGEQRPPMDQEHIRTERQCKHFF